MSTHMEDTQHTTRPDSSDMPNFSGNMPRRTSKIPKKQGLKDFVSIAVILVSAFVVAKLLVTYVVHTYIVDGPSMRETLHHGDRLLVNKVPRSIAKLKNQPFIPARGKIIVFNKRGLEPYDQTLDKQIIKRVIGLPGERVVVGDGKITVYNKENPDGFEPDDLFTDAQISTITEGAIDVTVPDNQVFVSGDNRPNSLDSRSFGPVPTEDIVGVLVLRIYPFNDTEKF